MQSRECSAQLVRPHTDHGRGRTVGNKEVLRARVEEAEEHIVTIFGDFARLATFVRKGDLESANELLDEWEWPDARPGDSSQAE